MKVRENMKNHVSRILSVIPAICMVVSLMPAVQAIVKVLPMLRFPECP